MSLSGLTIIRNAITNGYLVAEVIDTLRAVCDEVIVCDGFSTDGTTEYLQSRSDITLYQDTWDLKSQDGLEFARITDLGLSRCTGDYIFYLQADELVHESTLADIRALADSNQYNAISCEFYHIRYTLDHRLAGGYDRAYRIIRNRCGISSEYDGFSFKGNMQPHFRSDILIYHFGYVFLRNIFLKMINHADHFYQCAENYYRRKVLATEYLTRLDAGEVLDPLEIQKVLEPEYDICEHHAPIPACIERLRSATHYSLPES